MKYREKIRLWLLDKLLEESKEVNDEAERILEDIWPKHPAYREENLQVLMRAIVRARRAGKEEADVRQETESRGNEAGASAA